ncbi:MULTISPECIES: 2TM domain-containing protein [unclassified Actinopolyspora]|uniref:2TM domain-containing protein n=1 Tax=unclassified Actinopolyspora TaxID=2639451 RepID=UPI0013F61C98|nr:MULTISPECIES: 2TM domain-containing protein [unclassified Actinopolyspora]NHD15904.1 2TM domain-containing protein [Actinopolyspora sp. BKK2]NHE74882.1 2TM domain-containing protein [Actinopolyspora sp. BKK1]
MSQRPVGREPITNRQLKEYATGLVCGVAVVQVQVALLADSRPNLVTWLLLMGVGICALAFCLRHRTALRLRAYGNFFAHVLTYVIVNGFFWGHAAVLGLSGRGEVLTPGWFGALVPLSVLWGIGLVVHTFGALTSRGYDDVAV